MLACLLASIQKRTSPIKFDHLAEKSEYASISNLSTKVKNSKEAHEAQKQTSKDAIKVRVGLRVGGGVGMGGIRYGFRRARSRLYRNQILQVNTRWKALAEIYTMHFFAPFSNLNFFVKNAESFADFLTRILQNLPDFC